MSWIDYVNGYLVNLTDGSFQYANMCDHAALFGTDGTIWASTDKFAV